MSSILAKIDTLRVFKDGDRRAPHKPLLLLVALGRLQRGEDRLAPYKVLVDALLPLLRSYAPPVIGSHQPELPYWHLQGDDLWEVPGADNLPRQAGGFPRKGPLRETSAGFDTDTFNALLKEPRLVEAAALHILERHFPHSLHRGLLETVGLELGLIVPHPDFTGAATHEKPPRNRDFPRIVTRAYEHRCAVTGFQANLGGLDFGVEAAHVRAHAFDGPDELANGMLLNPLLHLLFDRGAWALTDDRRVLVSAKFTGSEEAKRTVRDLHGKELSPPLPGYAPVAVDYIQWHREPDLGGVFREPALPLDL